MIYLSIMLFLLVVVGAEKITDNGISTYFAKLYCGDSYMVNTNPPVDFSSWDALIQDENGAWRFPLSRDNPDWQTPCGLSSDLHFLALIVLIGLVCELLIFLWLYKKNWSS